jgi:hypothetical protein
MEHLTFQTPEIAAYCADLNILETSDGIETLIEAFAPKHTIIGMAYSSRANRMAFAHAVFLFYWKLVIYSPS